MASLGQRFDATAHDTDNQGGDYEDLPLGIYKLEVEATDVIDTGPEEARTGRGMKYTSTVLEPEEMAGRKFFGFINTENTNSQAQEIGQRELASMCRAMGLDGVEETEEFHFIPYTVKLGMGKPSKKKNSDGSPMYPARVEVKKYYYPDQGNVPEPAIDANQPARPAAANDNRAAANDNRQTARPAAAAAGGKARPWGKS